MAAPQGPPPGIFPLLTEECALGDGSDSNFLIKLAQHLRSHPNFRLPPIGRATPRGRSRGASLTPEEAATTATRVVRRLWQEVQHSNNSTGGSQSSPATPPPASGLSTSTPGSASTSAGPLSQHRALLTPWSAGRTPPPRRERLLLFAVRHYAGEVIYEAAGFREKNEDAEDSAHRQLLQHSTHRLVTQLMQV